MGSPPRRFSTSTIPLRLSGARSVGLSQGLPESQVVPALLDRLEDKDPVVRLAAAEELKQGDGPQLRICALGERDGPGRAVARWRAWWKQRQQSFSRIVRLAVTAMRPPCAIHPGREERMIGTHDPPDRGREACSVESSRVIPEPAVAACDWRVWPTWVVWRSLPVRPPRRPGARGAGRATLRSAVMTELGWMIGMGLPLVALVNVGMGSFLSMQSYFGGTFADGTGAIVGVGLVRNLGPLMAGLVLGGLFAARITPELRAVRSDAHGTRRERAGFLVRRQRRVRPQPARPSRPGEDGLLAARLLAGAVTGLVMSCLGLRGRDASSAGRSGRRIIGVSTHSFFIMFFDLLWVRDVVGLAIKGPLFGFLCVLFACHEGLWRLEATPERRHRGHRVGRMPRGVLFRAGDAGDRKRLVHRLLSCRVRRLARRS